MSNHNFHYHITNRPPLTRFLNQNNPAHILPHYCSKIHLNITLPATPKSVNRLAISSTYFPTWTFHYLPNYTASQLEELHLLKPSPWGLQIPNVFPYTGCNRRNGPNFGRVFLILNYTEKTQNTYVQSWTVWEIMAIENCGLPCGPITIAVS